MTDSTFAESLGIALRSEGVVTVLVTGRVRESGLDQVRTALKEVIELSRREDGCLDYDVFESDTRPGEMVFFERWASGAQLAAHQRQASMARYPEIAGPHLDGGLAMNRVRSVSRDPA